MNIKNIESAQNPHLKQVLQLQEKSKERQAQKRFVVEGIRELQLALAGAYSVKEVFYNEKRLNIAQLREHFPSLMENRSVLWVACAPAAFEKLAYREGVDNVVAVVEQKKLALEQLSLPDNPLILVMEGIEKPGNLGALLRTADAVAVDAFIVADPKADVYNPNVIRNSVGGLFTNSIAICSTEEAIAWLQARGIAIFTTYLEGADYYHHCNYTQACALVMGTEATGITAPWLAVAKARVKIPMLGKVDSMNVSNAAAVLLYEARRQRGF
jgi:TrmH family RNA methyltransferase